MAKVCFLWSVPFASSRRRQAQVSSGSPDNSVADPRSAAAAVSGQGAAAAPRPRLPGRGHRQRGPRHRPPHADPHPGPAGRQHRHPGPLPLPPPSTPIRSIQPTNAHAPFPSRLPETKGPDHRSSREIAAATSAPTCLLHMESLIARQLEHDFAKGLRSSFVRTALRGKACPGLRVVCRWPTGWRR